jgi:hypothetical protein
MEDKIVGRGESRHYKAVILATWEAKIRKILVQSQHRQIVCKTPSLVTRAKWTGDVA